MNTRKITATLVTLTLLVMATSSLFNDTNELQPNGIVEFGHGGGVANGTAVLGGILTWEDNAWNATWDCDGGLSLVTSNEWSNFTSSTDNDPQNFTSWGMELTGAGSYYTENAPEGEWVVTAGLTCIDDMGDTRSAGGQYGDVHENPPTVNLTNGTTIGDVSFTLIEHNGDDGPTFVCGDGEEIPFNWVNDGEEDCTDGADEQQYDADGNETNWFDCHDGSQVWIHQVNDGNDDCPDGEDEAGDDMSLEEIMEMVDSNGDGNLSLQEILDYVNEETYNESGENMSQEVEDMLSDAFAESDSDENGLLDINELQTFDDIMDNMDEGGDDGPTFVCGNGEEIPFNWVNDGEEDCEDGSDEQQYDADGNETNWFDCQDGSQVWITQVNDGNDDCPDGEDEGGESLEEIMEMVDSNGDGNLSLQEILDYFNQETYNESGENMSQEVEDMLSDAFADSDSDENGLLDINELQTFDDIIDNMDEGGDDGPTFVCGDGEEIPFDWVNDGVIDCTYGADEQQYDVDGNEINWFDCHDGSQVWITQVNDGNDDCPDGEDEGDSNSPAVDEIMEMVDADGDGNLSLQEILDFVNEIENEESGVNMSQEDEDMISDGFAESDSDGDGLLNLDEFEFFIDLMEEAEDSNGGDDGPDCDRLMEISFQQNADATADLTFTTTCVFDSNDSENMSAYWDTDDDGNLSSEELTAAQDAMDAEQTCYAQNGTEVPCGDDDDGLFSYDGVVMVTQPVMGDDSMALSVDLGIVTMSSTEVITVPSNSSLYSHLLEYDAGALWDGGNDECSGGVMVTASSPWNVSSVSFLPASDWVSAMNAGGTGWYVSNFDADEDGLCNSQPSNAVITFTTPEPEPEPEPVVDTAPTCEIYYNVGGVVLTANSTWSLQIQGAVSFEVPSGGDFTLALPVGEYSVILACNDAEGDAIVVSGTNGDDTWGGTAQDGVIYSEGLFTISDSNVSESVDITLTWSSTEFNGTFNTHFTAVESVTDALDVTDTGALPGFTSMISITAMLGAALILARRKD